jgi:hypothetical protein
MGALRRPLLGFVATLKKMVGRQRTEVAIQKNDVLTKLLT